MRKEKGQGSIEYLMILAIIAVIAIIVIAGAGAFTSMGGGVSASDSATYWSGAEVGITRYFISATSGNSMLIIRNNKQFGVNVTNVYLGTTSVYSTTTPLAPSVSTNLTLSNVPSCTAGNTYSIITTITYIDAVYGQTYNFTGDKPLVGTCQP